MLIVEGQTFTTMELAAATGYSKNTISTLKKTLNLEQYFHEDFCKRLNNWVGVYSYEAYLKIIAYKKLCKENVRGAAQDVIDMVIQQNYSKETSAHPLVTDKRCFNLNWWPDVSVGDDDDEETA